MTMPTPHVDASLSMKTIVEYHIYKKTVGVKYPGEAWEGPMTLVQAKKKFKAVYQDTRDGKPTRNQTFRIVKVTEQAVTP